MEGGENVINWTTTKEEQQKVKKVCDRANKGPGHDWKPTRMDLMMDIEATNANGCPLDFDKLLGFSDLDFFHDVYGISEHLDRQTGKLQNCFVPRCAR